MGIHLSGNPQYDKNERLSIPTAHARQLFVQAIERVYPGVTDDLWREVLPHFMSGSPEQAREALDAWAKRHGLEDFPWIVKHARITLSEAARQPDKPRPAHLLDNEAWWSVQMFVDLQDRRAHMEAPTLEIAGWNMLDSWADYEKRALEQVQMQLREYQKECEAVAKEQGQDFVSAPEKRGKDTEKHFEWLVLCTVPDPETGEVWSKSAIARDRDKTRAAVGQGIAQARALIEEDVKLVV